MVCPIHRVCFLVIQLNFKHLNGIDYLSFMENDSYLIPAFFPGRHDLSTLSYLLVYLPPRIPFHHCSEGTPN